MREDEDCAKLTALREAAQIGLDNIGAGRFRSFESEAALRAHLNELVERAFG